MMRIAENKFWVPMCFRGVFLFMCEIFLIVWATLHVCTRKVPEHHHGEQVTHLPLHQASTTMPPMQRGEGAC
jgi:hypothetical protein